MFAAASGARLAHRHNKAVKKQISTSQIEGLQIQYKGFQRQLPLKYSDTHGNRFSGIPHRRPNYATKLYCDPNLNLSSSYIDINGRILKLGHVDFEGKAAWQDRELNHEPEHRVSICVPSEAAVTHRTKQREAHSRWVKRNRIHDLSFGDCSSEDELLYGVQNGAANLLLYVGLGTMCVGMVIAFVGTGEKGFKTMELRLIGPSLIGAGVLIIIFRIMLCVCPSKCLKLKKHKLKNSMSKLNSEGNQMSQESSKEPLSGDPQGEKPESKKKRVSIAMWPTTSGLSTNSSENPKPSCGSLPQFVVPTTSYLENEKPERRKGGSGRKTSAGEGGEGAEESNIELKQLNGNCFEVASAGSVDSGQTNFLNLPENLVSPENSDISITSLLDASPPQQRDPIQEEEVKVFKFDPSKLLMRMVIYGFGIKPGSRRVVVATLPLGPAQRVTHALRPSKSETLGKFTGLCGRPELRHDIFTPDEPRPNLGFPGFDQWHRHEVTGPQGAVQE